jgi:hypothetical protein
MTEEAHTEGARRDGRPYRVKLPGFVRDEDIGLGEVVTRTTSALGIRPCGGCGRRAAALDRWMVFSHRRR